MFVNSYLNAHFVNISICKAYFEYFKLQQNLQLFMQTWKIFQ
ncbi:hypothetical protein Riv7116_3215 [Rivularia sp. PCC 7116]|nr:hypothetical protein Riv7116_3215 [Rivularia sp. PCC 7116]